MDAGYKRCKLRLLRRSNKRLPTIALNAGLTEMRQSGHRDAPDAGRRMECHPPVTGRGTRRRAVSFYL